MEGAEGNATVLSELESAIKTIVEHYNNYSSKKKTLIRKEGIGKSKFKEMLQSDLKQMLTETEDKEEVKRLMKKLDRNRDGVIDFKEYWDLIGAIVVPVAHNLQCQVEKEDGC